MGNDLHYAIAKTVRDYGPLSRAEIARSIHVSPSTVGRGVEALLEQHILTETGSRTPTKAGRPSTLLQFLPRIGSVITIDLRLTEAHAATTDLGGKVLDRTVRDLRPAGDAPADPHQSVEDLMTLIQELIDRLEPDLPLQAIVVGAPSLVGATDGVIEWAPSLGWQDLPLRDLLQGRFDLPVLIENDVNLAALGEFWKGAGRSVSSNLVFVSVGTGIGAGIIIDGRLYRGATNAAGEVAYFITDVKVLRDNAMQIADLENRVGRDGLIRSAQIVAQRYPTSQLADLLTSQSGTVRTSDILLLAEAGDQAARVIFNELVEILTIVACNIAVFLDPEMIILGGPSDWRWSSLIPEIQRHIGSSLLRPVNLQPSQLGNDAVILGGAYSALRFLV
jgi:predicted NBD/HSP70 family sugar kinase